MTRRNLRSKSTKEHHDDNALPDDSNDPVSSLGVLENNQSVSKVNGSPSEEKCLLKDVKDVPLKERLRSQRKKENGSIAEHVKPDKSMEVSTDGLLNENASTSDDKTEETKIPNESKNPDEAKSLAVLLGQGLTSGDGEKIDAVLSETNVHVISATLNDLPVTQILPLLKQIEYRLKNRHNLDIRCWVRWVQYIVSMHMAYLSTLGNLEEELKGLFDWMRRRTSQMGKLCELYGKLALVTEQLERRANPHLFILQEPKIFFTDENESSSESSEDEEEGDELEDESIASDENWWNDEEIRSDSDEVEEGSSDAKVRGRKKRAHSSDDETSGDDDSGNDAEEESDEGGSSEMEVE
ncbi:unnamed protein product [Enterobius vermicularis]|uniref:Utp12 domain-containing protein n=1 Tax=Enterobius vermicularis TaxID=51028 RepID=A0A0N4UWP2_ENTVE|nr:unnamed protein product [Enterobius vermicularis]